MGSEIEKETGRTDDNRRGDLVLREIPLLEEKLRVFYATPNDGKRLKVAPKK